MIYLVSSFHRSGSSMMMRCLINAGMAAVWDNSQEELNAICGRGDYLPNPNGFYALDEIEYNRPDFVKAYDGKLVKCPYCLLLTLPKHEYKLIFMQREPAEIRISMSEMTPYSTWGANEAITWFYKPIYAELERRLLERGDFEISVVKYDDILSQPEVEFEKLAKAGWAIDSKAAAGLIDPMLYRSRKERA